jgi:photosystem II stability/assembly factor-like uncharacterized protein
MKKFFLVLFFTTTSISPQWILQNSNTTVSLNAVHFLDSLTGFAGGDNGTILKTTDGGANWINIPGTTRDINTFKFFNRSLGFAAGKYIILKTTDGGNTWNSVYSNTTTLLYGITFIDSMSWVAVGSSSDLPRLKILKTTDCGSSWNLVLAVGQPLNAVSFIGNIGLAVGYNGLILKSPDAGSTWSQVVSGTSDHLFCIWHHTSTEAIAGGINEILRTTDGGTSWSGVFATGMYVFRSISFPDRFSGVAVGAQGADNNSCIIKTSDGGINWIEEPNSSYLSPGLRGVHFTDVNRGYAVGDQGTILHIGNAALPVELAFLKAEVTPPDVKISWSTVTETNNRGFEVERKLEGGNWILISFIPGAGTSTKRNDYNFIDQPESAGRYSYRLTDV